MRPRNRPGRPREIVQLDQLVAHGVGNAFTAIADVDGPDTTGHRVQMLFALLVPDTHAFAFDNDPWVRGFIGFVLAEVVPDVRAICLDHTGDIVFAKCTIHVRDLSEVGIGGGWQSTLFSRPHRKRASRLFRPICSDC